MPGGLDIERLYDKHAQPLFAFLLNLTRDEADTRDLLQEIFVKLARGKNLLAGIRDERTCCLGVSARRWRAGDHHCAVLQ